MLYPNGQRVFCSMPRAIAGALAASGSMAYGGLNGARLNRYVSGTYSQIVGAIPSGYGGRAWLLAVEAGGLAGRTSIAVDATGSGTMGLPASGSASITFTVADAAGELIVSGSGAASFAVSVADALATASINGSGAASFTVTAAPAQLGALADGAGIASFTVTGTLIPYAIGHMEGSTEDASVLTTQSIATAVWSALAAVSNDAGTMGAKLNTASSGGVDYAALADAVVAALEAATIPVNTVQIKGQTISGSGSPSDPWGP